MTTTTTKKPIAFVLALILALARVGRAYDTIEESYGCVNAGIGCVAGWNSQVICDKFYGDDHPTCSCDFCWTHCYEGDDGSLSCVPEDSAEPQSCFHESRFHEAWNRTDYGCGCNVGSSAYDASTNCDCRGIGSVNCGLGCGVTCPPPSPPPSPPPNPPPNPPPSPPPSPPPPSPPPNPTVIVTPSPPTVSIPPPSAEPPSPNENVVSAVSTLVGYTSQEFDSDRRRAFRSGVANFLNGVGEADVQIIQVTDVIARRRKLFQTQAPAIDVDYSVAVPSGSGETTMTVGAALRNDALVNSLKSEGLTSVTSMLTYVRAAPTTIQPPPPPPPASPTTPTTSTPVSPPANDTITPMDDTPDFSSERTAGLIAGAALIMFVSVAYQYRSKFFNLFRSLMWGRDLGKPSEDGLRDPPSRKSSLIDDSAALKEFTSRAD